MVRSPDALRRFLDSIMGGATVEQAAFNAGARHHSTANNWIARSKIDEAAGNTDSELFLSWPTEAVPDYFHNLYKLAFKRRSMILLGAWEQFTHGRFAVENGRAAFEFDDFTGAIAFDEFGMPKWKEILTAEPPTKSKHRENPDAAWERLHPRRELAPSSYGINKPREVPVPAYVGSALGDYLKGSKMTVDKQPSPMREELEAKLAEARANPNRESAKPRPTTIFGRPDPSAPQERISRPSDQTGLPINAEDAPRRAAPQPKPPAVDYSRRAPRVRLDAPGRG